MVILTRKARYPVITITQVRQPSNNIKTPDTPRGNDTFVTFDYSDVDSMAKALDEKNAWGIEYADTTPVSQARGRTLVELRTTDLEWTRFDNGFFLDYYGPTTLKSYMKRVAWAIDIANKKAGITRTVDEPMTFTYTLDVAKFVVAALDLPKWEELMYCYGEKTTWNKFLKQAEEAIGSKFDVSYDSPEKLERGEVTEVPFNENAADLPQKVLEGLMSLWGLYVLEGNYDIPTEKALNKVFPDIQPLMVEDVLGMWR
ncbi:hypothetical protein NW765_006993 [Fusarium oxysporum]|nr:hypothetical protein NW765_006993 [Fusarium oxysporum]KAJ4271074.1 hypothetical protein NW764_013439 [Fusarium oxysporum]